MAAYAWTVAGEISVVVLRIVRHFILVSVASMSSAILNTDKISNL